MECCGNGECLTQCECECSNCSKCNLQLFDCECVCKCDEDKCICFEHIMKKDCTCGHRNHKGMCKPEIPCIHKCEPVLCPNDKNHEEDEKGLMHPKWLLLCHGGNCEFCAITYGHDFSHLNEIKECSVCYQNKYMTSLRCNHEICWDCWSNICKINDNNSPESRACCPICRCKKW